MRHTIYYSFNDSYDDMNILEQDFKFMLEEKFEDIFEFEFENKYHKQANNFTWFLEPDAKEFYKSLEDRWQTNSIDYFKYLQDPIFYSWIKDKYYHEALELAYQKYNKINMPMAEYLTNIEE